MVETSVIDQSTFVNDHDALAKSGDVSHVVAGQQNGGVVLLIVFAKELAQTTLLVAHSPGMAQSITPS